MIANAFELLAAIGILVAVAAAVSVFRLMWRVAEPNEALIISGLHHRREPTSLGESMGFKNSTGRGTLVIPAFRSSESCRPI